MRGQASIEFVLLLSIIIAILMAVGAILYQKSSNLNSAFLNETGQYQIISSSFNINQSGSMYGKIEFSKYINFSTMNITFNSENTIFTVPFYATGVNTTSGYTSYLTENSVESFSKYLYNQYVINYMKYSNKGKTYFITANYTGYFN